MEVMVRLKGVPLHRLRILQMIGPIGNLRNLFCVGGYNRSSIRIIGKVIGRIRLRIHDI